MLDNGKATREMGGDSLSTSTGQKDKGFGRTTKELVYKTVEFFRLQLEGKRKKLIGRDKALFDFSTYQLQRNL